MQIWALLVRQENLFFEQGSCQNGQESGLCQVIFEGHHNRKEGLTSKSEWKYFWREVNFTCFTSSIEIARIWKRQRASNWVRCLVPPLLYIKSIQQSSTQWTHLWIKWLLLSYIVDISFWRSRSYIIVYHMQPWNILPTLARLEYVPNVPLVRLFMKNKHVLTLLDSFIAEYMGMGNVWSWNSASP